MKEKTNYNPGYGYATQRLTQTIDASVYIRDYRDAEKFIQFCRQCGNYCHCWACPPFDEDPLGDTSLYDKAIIVAEKITPLTPGLPLSAAREILHPVRIQLEKELRDMETTVGGRSFAFAGNCLYCPEGECTRPSGLPCRHPQLVRPSLEACGFDISKTTEELFGIPLKWGKDNTLPEYLTLVGGIFTFRKK